MDLKQFIKETIVAIVSGIGEAKSEVHRSIHLHSLSKDTREVEFDIAVTIEEHGVRGGKGGIKVLEFIQGGGEISKELTNSTVSRVRFGVRVV